MTESNRTFQQKSFSENVRKWKKRPHPPVYNGTGASEDKNNDYLCPICFEVIMEAHMTKCGHTFCHDCIVSCLEYNKRCPKCNFVIDNISDLYPNFLLNELIAKSFPKCREKKMKCSKMLENSNTFGELQSFLAQEKSNLTIEEVNAMLEILKQKKQQLEADCRKTQIYLLKEFLQKVQEHKHEELKLIDKQLKVIDADSVVVEQMLKTHTMLFTSHTARPLQSSSSSSSSLVKSEPSTSKCCNYIFNSTKQDSFNGSKYVNKIFIAPTMSAKKKRMHEHFEDLKNSYLTLRSNDLLFSSDENLSGEGLEQFDQNLSKFTQFTSVRPLANLSYSNDQFVGSNIVSSIEFEKDNEYFAIAGVTKKIKVFEYAAVIRDSLDVHYPINEMQCNSKISCVSWSASHQGMLASSDYEGTVTLWDVFTSQKLKTYQEHEKRCWSVDFNRIDTKMIASGSDDSKVKLWSTNMEHSLGTLEAKANVCCVKFNPENEFFLAFGSADHCVHYYDLRNNTQALEIFKGHKKAVSYVKFLNGKEIVSASTDSQLKLWNINNSHSLRNFKGHLNEKNFVGLATDGDFITCGSENNSLYIYYKGISAQMLTFKFEAVKSILEKDKGKEEESNEFVSAVCWRMGSNVIVAANSQGNIKVLELV